MSAKKIAPVMRGIAALMACLLVLSMMGTGIANTYRTALDDFFGTESFVVRTDEDSARFTKDYDTVEAMLAAARDIAVREGEEGTVILKNDNGALPMTGSKNVALFGLASYNLAGSKGGNSDQVNLEAALTNAGYTVNQQLKDWYINNIIKYEEREVENRWGGGTSIQIVATNMYATPGDWTDFRVVEIDPATWTSDWGVPANWKDSIPSDSIGIVTFARTGGEGNTYKPGSALDYNGNATGKDPLELSADELAVVDAAKATCSKVIVLLNSGYSMMIGDIAEGGAHEVDGIVYIGMPNDYQCEGIVNVLSGKVNPSGALANAFVRDHQSIPAVQNLGGDYYADYEIIARNNDPRYPGVDIANTKAGSFGGSATYNGGHYIVEAEGIYVGYKYYESRYFDAVMGQHGADSAAGSTQGGSWDYSKEMVYTFGYGLSYIPYTQTLKSVNVDRSANGDITAVVEIRNNGTQDGKFLAQLYVQQPYTDYDKQNLVEKSAVMFLTSGKVDVKAGQSAEVTLTVPAKYLASYDSNGAKTYILDAGDYLFTAAPGAHAAANNFLSHLGKTGDGTTETGAVVTWNLGSLDKTSFSILNGYPVTNVADDADLNYWLPGTVTYLTRQDWNTFPINYNTLNLKIADSPKKDEWIAELRGQTYTISNTGAAGAVVNTAVLASELKAALGDASPVNISLPEMPSLAETELTDGDNRDGDCFLYEPDGDALRLTGLTEEGARRKTLTLPVSHDRLPVASFAPEVFAQNTTIREIVIQSNISGIEDGSFEGCTALERLILENPAPERCAVGARLLEGTDALVYVPQGRLSAYRTNYFWAVHAGRIREGVHTGADSASDPGPAPSAPAPVSGPAIRYEGNGGALRAWEGDSISMALDNAHLRVNTAQGTRYFQREGYVLTGWNTAADGSGQHIGLGSRTERQNGLTLYAQWAESSPASDFRYEVRDGQVWITGYGGAAGRCVVPETIDGLPVRGICSGAFREAEFTALVLSNSLYTIEADAFSRCAVREICLFDSLREVCDESFADCRALTTLRVNAAVSPVFSGNYFDTFSDKYDWLLSIREQRKIVLFSGSSGRYGYDSPAIRAAFPDYQVANMGVYAYTNALPQLDLIRRLMAEGDILLSAPEFDAAPEQFCASNRLDAHFWAMMESNYDAAALLDLREYEGVFDSLGEYLDFKVGMADRSYGESPASYDDDANRYAFPTYNQYGDLILPRPNAERDERHANNIADYTMDNIPPEYVERLNEVYRAFLGKGVEVYFTYTPRNRQSLTEGSTPEARQALHTYLKAGLCVPVISEIEDSLFSGIYFYLIDSHLSSEGAAMRTRRVIEELRPWIT